MASEAALTSLVHFFGDCPHDVQKIALSNDVQKIALSNDVQKIALSLSPPLASRHKFGIRDYEKMSASEAIRGARIKIVRGEQRGHKGWINDSLPKKGSLYNVIVQKKSGDALAKVKETSFKYVENENITPTYEEAILEENSDIEYMLDTVVGKLAKFEFINSSKFARRVFLKALDEKIAYQRSLGGKAQYRKVMDFYSPHQEEEEEEEVGEDEDVTMRSSGSSKHKSVGSKSGSKSSKSGSKSSKSGSKSSKSSSKVREPKSKMPKTKETRHQRHLKKPLDY